MHASQAAAAIACYGLCSSCMLLINKMLVEEVPSPGLLVAVQLSFATFWVGLATQLGWFGLRPIQPSLRIMKLYAVYVSCFVLGVYANMRALKRSNVDTVIMFRSCTPLMVSLLDYGFMGRQLPGPRNLVALLGLVVGSIMFVNFDTEFQMEGAGAYFWVILYFTCIVIEMTIGKAISHQANLSLAAAVLYTNALSLLPMLCIALSAGEEVADLRIETRYGAVLLLLSCIIGCALGFVGWWCRSLLSATSYTVVGVANKFVTISLNALVWKKHATLEGTMAVLFCILMSTLYRQSPLRERAEEKSPYTRAKGFNKMHLEEGGKLLGRAEDTV